MSVMAQIGAVSKVSNCWRTGVALVLATLALWALPGAGAGSDPETIVLEPNYPTANEDYQDIAFKAILDQTPVVISMTDRTVLGFGSTSLSFGFKGHSFDGSGSLNIRGDWNPAGGYISGVFAYEWSMHHDFGFDPETESAFYSGTLTGKVLPTDTASIGLYGQGQVVHVHNYDQEGKRSLVNYDAAAPTFPYLVRDPEQLIPPSGSPGPTVPYEDSGVRFSDLAGQVEINMPQPDGSYDPEDWHSAKLNQVLPVDTHIRTMEKSEAILSFADMSQFHLKPEAEVILSSASDKQNCGVKGAIRLIAGNMWANIKKMAKDGCMQVEMSQAVAGIKGTTFVVSDDLLSSTLQVAEGTVTFTATDGTQATVGTGQQATATAEHGVGEVTPSDVGSASGYGTIDHAALGPAPSDTPSPVAEASAAPTALASNAPASAAPTAPASPAAESTAPLLLIVAVVVIAVIGLGVIFVVRRRPVR